MTSRSSPARRAVWAHASRRCLRRQGRKWLSRADARIARFNFEASLERATERLERWRRVGSGDGALEEVRRRLDDDLDAPAAVHELDAAAATGAGVSQGAALLGVTL